VSVEIAKVVYTCDWIREDGDVCTATGEFDSAGHEQQARDTGWGWYSNAHLRWMKWENGRKSWYCPIHATQFRENHGWGGLEDYGPPKRWWKNFFST